ncbi:MAG TPA: hypothetical protein VN706_23270 [Gemmatimonadaceae bacterium]|nr:hypothetical protein [Gemmatimonadaceae bacterium]
MRISQRSIVSRAERVTRFAIVAALIGLGACAVRRARGLTGSSVARVTMPDPLFDFRVNPWVNLHHFLYEAARGRRGLDSGREGPRRAAADTAGIGSLTARERGAWDRALNYYDRTFAQRDILFDTTLVAITDRLSDLGASSPLADARLDSELTSVLAEAMPVYRVLWWPRHRAADSAWIASVRPYLARYGNAAAAREARAFATSWPDAPVRVDVSEYTSWAGAYTTTQPSRINMGAFDPMAYGAAGLKTLFHEVLHTMDDTLFAHFQAQARAERKRMRRDPTHVFIFYTAGETVAALIPGYIPFGERTGFWKRTNDMDGMRPLLARYWQPWLDGRGTFDAALRAIAAKM